MPIKNEKIIDLFNKSGRKLEDSENPSAVLCSTKKARRHPRHNRELQKIMKQKIQENHQPCISTLQLWKTPLNVYHPLVPPNWHQKSIKLASKIL